MTGFDPSTMSQFFSAVAGDIGPLATTFAGDVSPLDTALACGVGQFGAMFTHCLRQLSTALAGLPARLLDHGCALFGGGAGELATPLAGGLDQGRATRGSRTGQLSAALSAGVEAVGDPFGQLGIEHRVVGPVQR